MRQILYVSTSTAPGRQADLDTILHQSRHNNALDGITGLLWVRGACYVQVLEGAREAVGKAMERICADPRHSKIHTLIDRAVDSREFGSWSMAIRHGSETPDELDHRVAGVLASRSEPLKTLFGDLFP